MNTAPVKQRKLKRRAMIALRNDYSYSDYISTLYPQKLALNSPKSGGRSVGIVRLRTKATEFSFSTVYRKGHAVA
jgi:hypothetical protein